eukprot:5713865-Prymnesium_polylepis.1
MDQVRSIQTHTLVECRCPAIACYKPYVCIVGRQHGRDRAQRGSEGRLRRALPRGGPLRLPQVHAAARGLARARRLLLQHAHQRDSHAAAAALAAAAAAEPRPAAAESAQPGARVASSPSTCSRRRIFSRTHWRRALA